MSVDMESARDEDRILAGEYALGLMDPREQQLFEARMLVEADLRAEVAKWQEDLVSLHAGTESRQPPARVKAAIERRLFGVPVVRPGFVFLRFLAGGAAAALVLALVVTFWPAGARPEFIAHLSGDSGLAILAELDADQKALKLHVEAGRAPDGRALELWLIAEGATAPISLGLMPESGDMEADLTPEQVAAISTGTLAISDEPPGGSPTGQPTGQVLALGKVEPV